MRESRQSPWLASCQQNTSKKNFNEYTVLSLFESYTEDEWNMT